MMRLNLDGQSRDLIVLTAFRTQHNLSTDFAVALFEPKDRSGLGRIDRGGAALQELRTTVLSAVPPILTLPHLMDFIPQLSNLFRVKLYEVNEAIGLRPVEVDFAAAGFEDVCQALAYALVQAHMSKTLVDFEQIYAIWLDGTTRVAANAYPYDYHGETWYIHTLHNAYGRVGLLVITPTDRHYIQDTALACPAEGFMHGLLAAVAAQITFALA